MTGLVGTVGYTQVKTDGTTAVARTTTGIVEIGNGAYGVTVTPDAATAIIKWDSGGGTPMYAFEEIGLTVTEIVAGVAGDSKTLTVPKFLALK